MAGGWVNHSGANAEVIALAERLGAPVVTTLSGQASLHYEHPPALGVVGDNEFHPHPHRAVEAADVLLYVGCKMESISTIKRTLPSVRARRKISQIDIDPILLANGFENTVSAVGDTRLVLEDLLELVPPEARSATARVDDLNRARASFWRELQVQLHSESTPLKQQRVFHELNQRRPSPSIVIADAGTLTPYVTRFLRLISDGTLGMSAGEPETLAQLNEPAVQIHFNNDCFRGIQTPAIPAQHG